MNNLLKIHFSGTLAKDSEDKSIYLTGHLLSTELCISKGILSSFRSTYSTIYLVNDLGYGTGYYGIVSEYKEFWKYSRLPEEDSYIEGCTLLSEYRKFLLINMISYL